MTDARFFAFRKCLPSNGHASFLGVGFFVIGAQQHITVHFFGLSAKKYDVTLERGNMMRQ